MPRSIKPIKRMCAYYKKCIILSVCQRRSYAYTCMKPGCNQSNLGPCPSCCPASQLKQQPCSLVPGTVYVSPLAPQRQPVKLRMPCTGVQLHILAVFCFMCSFEQREILRSLMRFSVSCCSSFLCASSAAKQQASTSRLS